MIVKIKLGYGEEENPKRKTKEKQKGTQECNVIESWGILS